MTVFPPDAFAGTSEAYLRYRPAYPETMLQDLRRRAGTTGRGTLLDVGCGPGRVAIPLAPYFHRVLAVDAEAEMTAVGRDEALRRGVGNIEWRTGRAEDLSLSPDSVELMAFGESFHRVDRPLMLERAGIWLAPGGSLVTMGCNTVFQSEAPWHHVVCDVMRKWTGGWAGPKSRAEARKFWTHDSLLLAGGFSEVSSHEFLIPHTWTVDEIVGYMDATSGASRRILGNRAEACHAELTRALLDWDSRGAYADTLWFAYTIARAPGVRTSTAARR